MNMVIKILQDTQTHPLLPPLPPPSPTYISQDEQPSSVLQYNTLPHTVLHKETNHCEQLSAGEIRPFQISLRRKSP